MAMNPNTGYEVPPEMRDFAEKSVDQARKALDGFIGAAHKAVETFQGSTSTVQSSVVEATRKTLSYAEQNLSASFEHAQKLVRAKDMQEALSLQTEFARTQFQAMQHQLKELTELAQASARSAAAQAQTATNQAAATARSTVDQTTSST
jgi:phasin